MSLFLPLVILRLLFTCTVEIGLFYGLLNLLLSLEIGDFELGDPFFDFNYFGSSVISVSCIILGPISRFKGRLSNSGLFCLMLSNRTFFLISWMLFKFDGSDFYRFSLLFDRDFFLLLDLECCFPFFR